MRVYGYKKKELSPKGLFEMREVTFVASAATLRELAGFFARRQMSLREIALGSTTFTPRLPFSPGMTSGLR